MKDNEVKVTDDERNKKGAVDADEVLELDDLQYELGQKTRQFSIYEFLLLL